MRKSRFSEAQIVHILRQADVGEKTVGQLCREHGISENTFYRWRRHYGGMGLSVLRRQRQLEQENARLKRLLAERDLEVDALRELLAKKCDRGEPQGCGRLPAAQGCVGAAGLPTAAPRSVQPALPPP
jgi:putative transposase